MCSGGNEIWKVGQSKGQVLMLNRRPDVRCAVTYSLSLIHNLQ